MMAGVAPGEYQVLLPMPMPFVHMSCILKGIKTIIARNHIILHLVVYFQFHNTEKFIRIQLINNSK